MLTATTVGHRAVATAPWVTPTYWLPCRPAPVRLDNEPLRWMVSVPVRSGVPATTLFSARLGLGFQIVPHPSMLLTDSHHVRSRRRGRTSMVTHAGWVHVPP